MSVDAAIITGLLTNSAPLILNELKLFRSFKKEVKKLSNTLSSLNATLKDAERKNLDEKDHQTEDWLRKLKDVAYEVRDIVDECTFEDLRLQVKRLNACSSIRLQVTNSITHLFSNTRMRLKIGHKIKDIQEKLDQISSEHIKFQLPETTEDLTVGGRETMSLISVNVYGRDEERKRIVDILVDSSKDDKRLSVISIIGMGGLGKTTLAQMIFNDENVDKHFDTKFWVCISEEFDIYRVMRDIIGDKTETNLEELQKKVRGRLNGKRYLIVLDDVWNEDENKWDTLRSVLDCGSDGAFVLATTRKRKVAEIMKTNQHFELPALSDDACWLLFKERAFRDERSNTQIFYDIGLEIAKKCKGVPLVAKTLGAQLGFKIDVKEWCRIRDYDMWKLSQNEEDDILHILRLSYYDLPYALRRCFAFCAVFPKDTEIEKEMLIQLWMSHDLIPTNENQEVEDVGNQIWDELCWRSFFQDEKEEIKKDIKRVQITCKMHDFMHDLAKSIMKDECCTMDAKSSSENFIRDIRHIMVVDKFTKISTISFQKIRSLQSIIFHPNIDEAFSKEVFRVLKKLASLRVFEACNGIQGEDLHYVGCLKHLRYLNLSCCKVKTLPNSVCDLLNLRTLNLNECSYLESLPKKMKDLINLRHLHLRGCNELKYMPKGIGRLRHLKTLSLFVINKESVGELDELKELDIGELDELKELDIGGSMEIRNLEKVSDACIARGGISMSQKSRINYLVLRWKIRLDEDDEMKSRDEKIGEALEVSSSSLKILIMKGYKGVNIPKWMGKSYASLTMLHLSALDNVEHVFTINNKNLSDLDNDMDGTVCTLFPLLEELKVSEMENLREIVSSPIPTTGAFPNLRMIEIKSCPKLGALPPHLKSLKDVTVYGKCTDELLYSISDLGGKLTRLRLYDVNERSVLFPCASTSSNDMNETTVVTLFPLLEELDITDTKNLRELVSPPNSTTTGEAFPNLRMIEIKFCPKLGSLPPHLKSLKDVSVVGKCSDKLLYSISDLSGQLTRLHLNNVNERSVLFPCASTSSNDMNGTVAVTLFPLLEELVIKDMKNLRELVSPPISISTSTTTTGGAFLNLRKFKIADCPKLGALPPHLKSLKDVTIMGECTNELLYSISNLSALTRLSFWFLRERSVLFGGGNYYCKADENENEITSSSSSTLAADNINEAQGGSAASTFQSLKDLYIGDCDKLSCLFDEEGCEKLARGGGGLLTNLNSLFIFYCRELMISLEQWRNLTHSLQYLWIEECPKLVPSKVEEADEVLQLLRSLRERLGTNKFFVDILNNDDERNKLDDERRRRRRSRRSIFLLCN